MPTQHGSDNVTSGIVDFMVKFRELSTYDSSSMLKTFWITDCISRPGAENDIEADEAVTNCHRRSSTLSRLRRDSPKRIRRVRVRVRVFYGVYRTLID